MTVKVCGNGWAMPQVLSCQLLNTETKLDLQPVRLGFVVDKVALK
jgi:hypothetical protein